MKKRTTITVNADLYAAAKGMMMIEGCDSFSEFVEHLIRTRRNLVVFGLSGSVPVFVPKGVTASSRNGKHEDGREGGEAGLGKEMHPNPPLEVEGHNHNNSGDACLDGFHGVKVEVAA